MKWIHNLNRRSLATILAVLFVASCAQIGSKAPPPTQHALIGRWTAPLDGRPGYVREFFPDGTMKVWWPDGTLAAEGKFFVVDEATLGVNYANHDTDVVHLHGDDKIQIDHVDHAGSFRKYFAERAP